MAWISIRIFFTFFALQLNNHHSILVLWLQYPNVIFECDVSKIFPQFILFFVYNLMIYLKITFELRNRGVIYVWLARKIETCFRCRLSSSIISTILKFGYSSVNCNKHYKNISNTFILHQLFADNWVLNYMYLWLNNIQPL